MRFSRHARNRLRWIQRSLPSISEKMVLEALASGETIGGDAVGNRRIGIRAAGASFVIVVDDARGLVITIWRED